MEKKLQKFILNLYKKFNSESGFALVTVLMVFSILVVLGMSYVTMTINEIKQSESHNNKVQAYYYARSGAEKTLASLSQLNYDDEIAGNIDLNADDEANLYLDNDYNFCGSDSPGKIIDINVKIMSWKDVSEETISDINKIKITSWGYVKNFQDRVTLIINVKEGATNYNIPPFDMALFAVGESSEENLSINLSGSANIIGQVWTNATTYDAVSITGGSYIDGDLNIRINQETEENTWSNQEVYHKGDQVWYDGHKYTATKRTRGDQPDNSKAWETEGLPLDKISGVVRHFNEEVIYPEPVFPNFPESLPEREDFSTPWVEGEHYEIDQDGEYHNIEVSSNRTLTIDMGGGDRIIRVKNLNISQGHIELINKGEDSQLKLYVEDEFSLKGSGTINNGGNIKDVIMYYKGQDEPDFGGNTRFVGSLFAETSNISISGSNGVTGHVITGGGEVNITGDADMFTRVLYAPHANVNITGSGKIKGCVIADRLNGTGSGLIEFEEPNLDSFPVEIFPTDENDGGNDGGNTDWVEIDRWSD